MVVEDILIQLMREEQHVTETDVQTERGQATAKEGARA